MALHRERACVLCGHQEGFAVEVLGGLIGPVGEDARSRAPLWVHRECAIWSPEVGLQVCLPVPYYGTSLARDVHPLTNCILPHV